MENNVGDVLHFEEQLRTTLHYDDKEKLRRKLALLQREYLRTAQRLQRAERSEAVRRHVKSRITQQNHQDQRDPEVTSNPCLNPSLLTLDTHDGTASGVPHDTGGLAHSDISRRSQGIRFLLPSVAACPQTPDPSHDAARGHRPSPALRLRSRRSRLRWERRSSEAGRSTDNSQEGQEQSERMDTVGTEGSEEKVKTEGTEVVNESEELFSGTEESPSLLLTHWNTCGQTERGDMEGKEIQGRQDQKEKETQLRVEGQKGSMSLLLTCWNSAIPTDGTGHDDTQNGRRKQIEEGENNRGQRDGRLCEDRINKDTESEKNNDNTVEIKEENSEMVGGQGVGLLESCTLVEGLLFPAEYYVRTTRRMTVTQSQPDMQAIMLSQLSMGRHRRSRGRGRGLNRHTRNQEGSDQHSQTVFSSPTTTSPSIGPSMESQASGTSSERNSRSSSEISDQILVCQVDADACFTPTVTTARPARGRRRRRGRGRGRPQTRQCSFSLDIHQTGLAQTSDGPQHTSSPVSSSPPLHGADGSKPCLAPGEAAPVPDDPEPASTHSTAPQPSSGVNGAQSSSASGHLEKVYPIFLNSSGSTNGSTQMSRRAASWRTLLLPCSAPAQSSLLPLPSLSPGPLVNNLTNFDIPQDFHLPDDQFASLKLHKLRQVAVESGVENFASHASRHPRRSSRRPDARYSGNSDPVMSLPLPLSLTPTIARSPHPTDSKEAATRSVDLQNLSIDCKITDKLTIQSFTEESSDRENPAEQQTENVHPERQTRTTSTESLSVDQDAAADSVDQYKEQRTVILNTQSSVSVCNTRRCIDQSVEQPHINFEDGPAGKVNSDALQITESSVLSSEEQADCPGVIHPLEDQGSTSNQTEDKAFDCPVQKTPEEPSKNCTALQACNDIEAPTESPAQHLNVKSPAKDPKESAEPTMGPARDRLVENIHQDNCGSLLCHSQLLSSPPLASAPCPFITPCLHSSALPSSPTLPSLGLTPHAVPAAFPLTSSPSAPALTLPPAHSPSTRALSPPALSPCPTLTSLPPPSQPPISPADQIQATCPTVSTVQSQGPGGQVEEPMRCTHTLKAPAGGCLVDACCLPGSSGGLCVAAAGKWAVCLWSQTSASDWSLTHTWAFNEPLINVFPVPDAAGLMCVTLGQLEIREVRMLSCSSLLQVLLCAGLVQAVVGVSKSRVVTSSYAASGSTLQALTLSDSGSAPSSQPLVCPGVCVRALAPVEGLSDALIGSDEAGCVFVWNLKTGQLLRRIVLGDGLSHTACLRGYSYCGVLFVLLQHQLLSSPEEEENKATAKHQMCFEEEGRKKTALFTLVAVNPLSGKAVQATRLYPPKAWSGRLCEADVSSSSVVGLSQSGRVCVWELLRRGASRMVWAPESEGWQLARWGGGGTLVTGHHNGDVTLHCYSASKTSPCH